MLEYSCSVTCGRRPLARRLQHVQQTLQSRSQSQPTGTSLRSRAEGDAARTKTGRRRSASRPPSEPDLLGSDPNDDLELGKKQYRANNFGIAERYFRRAVETHPRDAEAWVGLAASYDRLRRFDLADRAYKQAIGISARQPKSSTTRAIPTCCAAISARPRDARSPPTKGSEQHIHPEQSEAVARELSQGQGGPVVSPAVAMP